MIDLLPSAPALTVAWLKGNLALTAIHGGRVGTRLNATLPAIRVQRIGGPPREVWEDVPLMQVECWAADEAAADLLVRTVIAESPTFRGTFATGRVYTGAIDSGPYWAPDDPALSNNARYVVTMRLLTSP